MTKHKVSWISLLILFASMMGFHCDLTKNISTTDFPTPGFGKYMITVKSVVTCSILPEPVDNEGFVQFSMKGHEYNRSEELVSGQIYLPKNIKFVKANYWPLFGKKDGSFHRPFNLSSNDPCNHFFLSWPVMFIWPNTSKDCTIKKGNYSIVDLSINEWTHVKTLRNFVYGRLQVRLEYYTESGLVLCMYANMDVSGIPKAKRRQKSHKKKPKLDYRK